MPDRTQTLSVDRETCELAAEALADRAKPPFGEDRFWQANLQLRALLSQREHQGDEEKEQIEEAFEALAGYVPAGRENLNLKTLRNLASREHRGEETYEQYRQRHGLLPRPPAVEVERLREQLLSEEVESKAMEAAEFADETNPKTERYYLQVIVGAVLNAAANEAAELKEGKGG